MRGSELFEHVIEDLMRGLDGQVEADCLKQDVFVEEDGVAPAPEVLCLLVHKQGRVLLRDAAAGDDNLLHLPTRLFDFGGEEDGRCSDFLAFVSLSTTRTCKEPSTHIKL